MQPDTEILSDLSKDDIQKIDFLIYEMREGKFDDLIRKVEFKNKLAGDFVLPNYIGNLLGRIATLEQDNEQLMSKIHSMEDQLMKLVSFTDSYSSDYRGDMQDIAKALSYLFNPDPLNNSWELEKIDQFVGKYGAKKY